MSSIISEGASLFATTGIPVYGVSDVEIFEENGSKYLAVASAGSDALVVFDIDGAMPSVTGSATETDTSGTNVLVNVTVIDGPEGQRLLAGGRYDDNLGIYDVTGSGALTQTADVSDSAGRLDNITVAESVRIGGMTYVYVASGGDRGFATFELREDDRFVRTNIALKQKWAVDDVTVLSHIPLHGKDFLFAASGFDAGVTAFILGPDGRPEAGQTFTSAKASTGLFGITDVAGADVDGRAYIVVASSGTDSLSVLRVSKGGKLKEKDVLLDQAGMRIAKVQELETVTYDGRVYVFAGGGDNGISVFELTRVGKLNHLETIADDFDTALTNVSAIAAEVVGSTAQVWVGSSTEHGVTRLEVDLDRSGITQSGVNKPDVLIGTAGDDVLWGRGKDDEIRGGDGADRLIDGRGNDHLWGGAGADVFEFIDDNRSDFIYDFEFGVDKIDVSDWGPLFSYKDLTIGTREKGAAILFGDEIIRLRNPDGGPYDAALLDSLGQDDFIFG